MRELIIRCDHCGKVITGDPYKVCLEQAGRETGDFSIDQTEDQKKVREMDWCESCFHNLIAFLLDTSHKLLAVAPVLPKEAASEPVQETIAEESASGKADPDSAEADSVPDGSGGAPKRNRIDMGKLKALYEAEWPAKKIAIEFGVTEGAVWNAVHRMKKQEAEDEEMQ